MNIEFIKVLLIEDNPADAELIALMLEGRESPAFATVWTQRLSEGLARLRQAAYDVVLLDLSLPDSRGIETLHRLLDEAPDTSIIVLTGTREEEFGIETISLGAQDYLVKGRFDRNLLLKSIRYSIERKRVEEELKKSRDLSEALTHINAIINSTLDPDEIMKKIVVEAALAIGCESSALDTLSGKTWTIRYVYNFPEDAVGRTFTSREVPFVDITLAAKKPVVLRDAYSDERANPDIQKAYGVRSVMAVPLLVRDAPFGILFFNYHSGMSDFTDAQVDFAAKLSVSVSLALQNANLYAAVRKGEERLRNSEETLRLAAQATGMGTFDYRPLTGELRWSELAKSHFGLNANDDVDYQVFLAGLHPEDRDRISSLVEHALRPESGGEYRAEYRTIGFRDGRERWLTARGKAYFNRQGQAVRLIGATVDITDRKRLEEEIRHMAQHDALTGLPNRRLFIDILRIELAQARRHNMKLAILFLDLDRFKEINDTLGHEIGDRLLSEVARRFRKTIREADTVARIGGDEFNMILSDIAQAERVSDIARKIVDSLKEPVVIDGHQLHTSTSVGISIYPDDGEDGETLLRYADIAMYHAKESGRNTFRYYNPSIDVRSVERMKMENLLRQSIARQELAIHYQPQVDLRTNRISYAEALVRWNHPERGLLEPKEFLPLAEETGFIAAIDEWVLSTVCGQAKTWKDGGFDSFCVAVNLSARQFQNPDLVALVSGVLRDTGMQPQCLDIEVTESTAMNDIERTASQLAELTKMGMHISIDDFGTGYSSLNYLKKLPIERIKIDRSFILDIVEDADDRAIISAVTSMARQMGIKTVAEGVETREQLAFVKEAGCDEVQGFLLGRPLPPEEFRMLSMG